jgi:hypothetical protein
MNSTIAELRAKQMKALHRANSFYRIAAILGPLVFAASLFELGRNEPHAVRTICFALFAAVGGVSGYFNSKREIRQLRELREE